ncbi:hypothetical protein GCM10007879_06970 [Maritalea porphyrae]|uniref:Tryptophan synthase beta chain-like PALP domain-containing protein n=2 Tax=Maritalea porphyrae TaxID=880732 RepID=A0ABQ5UPB8_9HYPH|nr:hypothetical protein GCM10007879_06970 [Maritalea porphyrae]
MGLGAFKALGGVYAVAQLMLTKNGTLTTSSDKLREETEKMTFVCASAGNHGMAVAAGARIFGAHARIHLAKTVPQAFVSRLEAQQAQVIRSGDTYEESVQIAIKDAAENNYIHLADGSWQGYTEPPRLVMEGYTVIAEEMRAAFAMNGEWPTHVFLQAGVGGLAAAIAYMIRKNWSKQPEIIVVEPDEAPCLKTSVETGELTTVDGAVSNMGRLDCKTPSMLAFEVLKAMADRFVVISDAKAAEAQNLLNELGLPTTPSGAAGLAGLNAAALPVDAKPLIIVTEGQV